jgi:hypothetical protein
LPFAHHRFASGFDTRVNQRFPSFTSRSFSTQSALSGLLRTRLANPLPALKRTVRPPVIQPVLLPRAAVAAENPPPVLPDESSSPRKNILLSEIANL